MATNPKWLQADEILLIQPQTPEEMDDIAEDIRHIASMLPDYEEDFIEGGMREFPDNFTVVYHLGQPVAYIEINDARSHSHLGKDSMEFTGAVLPEYRDKGLTQMVSPIIIRHAFKTRGKRKMLASIPDGNDEARFALSALGFRRIGRDAQGALLYKLDRREALA